MQIFSQVIRNVAQIFKSLSSKPTKLDEVKNNPPTYNKSIKVGETQIKKGLTFDSIVASTKFMEKEKSTHQTPVIKTSAIKSRFFNKKMSIIKDNTSKLPNVKLDEKISSQQMDPEIIEVQVEKTETKEVSNQNVVNFIYLNMEDEIRLLAIKIEKFMELKKELIKLQVTKNEKDSNSIDEYLKILDQQEVCVREIIKNLDTELREIRKVVEDHESNQNASDSFLARRVHKNHLYKAIKQYHAWAISVN